MAALLLSLHSLPVPQNHACLTQYFGQLFPARNNEISLGRGRHSAVHGSHTPHPRCTLTSCFTHHLRTFPFSITARFNVSLVLCAVASTQASAVPPLCTGLNVAREFNCAQRE
jgi:hypothetical protein